MPFEKEQVIRYILPRDLCKVYDCLETNTVITLEESLYRNPIVGSMPITCRIQIPYNMEEGLISYLLTNDERRRIRREISNILDMVLDISSL